MVGTDQLLIKGYERPGCGRGMENELLVLARGVVLVKW